MYPTTLVMVIMTTTIVNAVSNCPRSCRCDSRRTVYCLERNLYTVPYGIPNPTETLFLQGNQIRNGRTTDEILSGLENLVKLDMHQNKLTAFPRGLPTTLQHISLRSNSIKYVGKTSLKGLTSLNELHLDENNITNQGLSPTAFADANNLEVLVLSSNSLTAFPEQLPVSLRHLRLDNNRIDLITLTSVNRLTNLINLDLSQNRVVQTGIDHGAMISLSMLRYLDMSYNKLGEIPNGLPASLTELMLSNNQIECIYENENDDHGSLKGLRSLSKLDLSSNNLKSVMNSALDDLNIRSMELQDNPWQCDCHLHYFKQWLTTTQSVLSSQSNIRCNSPSAFLGVTLNSIDPEALNCDARENTQGMMEIIDVGHEDFRVLWKSHTVDTPDPPFVTRKLMFGPLLCQNCSLDASVPENSDITSWLASYSFQDVTPAIHSNPQNTSVLVDRLQPATHYAVCIFDSQQDVSKLTKKQCRDVWTSAYQPTTIPTQENKDFIPLWLIVFCCGVVLFVSVGIVGFVIWKRKSSLKEKTTRVYSQREDLQYPETYLPGFAHPNTGYLSAAQISEMYGTNMTNRTYAECGPALSTNQRVVRESGVDARTEFDLLIKHDDDASKRVHTPMSSYSGESRDDGTISTNRTGLSTLHNHTEPPSPTYDSLHSFECFGHAGLCNGVSTTQPRLAQEAGSFV